MIELRRARGYVLVALVGLVACQPAAGDELAQMNDRLHAAEAQIAAMQAKVDAMQTKVDAMQTKLDAGATRDEALAAARRARIERLGESGSESDDSGEGDAPPIDVSGVTCEGLDTPSMRCQLAQSFLNTLLDDPDALARQARIVPVLREDVTAGFKIYGIRPGSLPKALGFKNGDTVLSVAGKSLDSLDAALDVYNRLRKGGPIVIKLERKGAPLELTLDITE